MWLLKFHLAFSFLCWITFIGFSIIGREIMINNGFSNAKNLLINSIFKVWLFFVPLLNIFAIISLFMMLTMKKSDFDKIANGRKDD